MGGRRRKPPPCGPTCRWAKRKAEEAKRRARDAANRARQEAEKRARQAREAAERARREAQRRAREAADRARREAERRARQVREAAERARREAERRAREAAERVRREAEKRAREIREAAERAAAEARRIAEEAARKARELAELIKAQLEAALDILRRIRDLKNQVGRLPAAIENLGRTIQSMVLKIKEPFERLVKDIEATFKRIGRKLDEGLKLTFTQVDKIFTQVLPQQMKHLVATGFGGLLSENEKDEANALKDKNGIMSQAQNVGTFMSEYIPPPLTEAAKILERKGRMIVDVVNNNIKNSILNTMYTTIDNPYEQYIKPLAAERVTGSVIKFSKY